MKKFLFALIFFAIVIPVFAHYNITSDDIYVLNVSIERIFPTSQGYLIQYRGHTSIHTIAVPIDWFRGAATRADIVRLPRGPSWPSMSVFFVNREFSHVRLYVHPARSHITWGNLPLGTDISGFFPEEGTFSLQF